MKKFGKKLCAALLVACTMICVMPATFAFADEMPCGEGEVSLLQEISQVIPETDVDAYGTLFEGTYLQERFDQFQSNFERMIRNTDAMYKETLVDYYFSIGTDLEPYFEQRLLYLEARYAEIMRQYELMFDTIANLY